MDFNKFFCLILKKVVFLQKNNLITIISYTKKYV